MICQLYLTILQYLLELSHSKLFLNNLFQLLKDNGSLLNYPYFTWSFELAPTEKLKETTYIIIRTIINNLLSNNILYFIVAFS